MPSLRLLVGLLRLHAIQICIAKLLWFTAAVLDDRAVIAGLVRSLRMASRFIARRHDAHAHDGEAGAREPDPSQVVYNLDAPPPRQGACASACAWMRHGAAWACGACGAAGAWVEQAWRWWWDDEDDPVLFMNKEE